MANSGIVQTFTDNSSSIYFSVADESKNPSEILNIFISEYDKDYKNPFYCSVGGEVREGKYRDLTLPACCVFHNSVQQAQMDYTTDKVDVVQNNITNVQNSITNVVNNSVTQILGVDNSAQVGTISQTVSDLQNQLTKANGDILTLNTWAATFSSTDQQSISDIQGNSQLIANLQTLTSNQANVITNNTNAIAANQTSITQINQQIQTIQSLQGSDETNINGLSEKFSSLQTTISTQSNDISQSKQSITDLQSGLQQTKTDFQSFRDTTTSNFSKDGDNINQLQNLYQTLSGDIQRRVLVDDFKVVQTSVTQNQTQIKTNADLLVTTNNNLSSLQSTVTKNSQDVGTIQNTTLPSLQTSITTIQNTTIPAIQTSLSNQVSKEAADVLAIQGTGFVSGVTLASLKATNDAQVTMINKLITVINNHASVYNQMINGNLLALSKTNFTTYS